MKATKTNYVDSLNKLIDKNREKMRRLEDDKSSFTNKISEMEMSVCGQAHQLHDLIERQKKTLLDELRQTRQTRVKEVDSLHYQLEKHTSMMASFEDYVKQLNHSEEASGLVRLADSLKTRFDELANVEVRRIERSIEGLGNIYVSLTSDSKWKEDLNAIGKITIKLTTHRPILVKSIES